MYDTRRPPHPEENLFKMGYVFLVIIPLAIQTYVGPCSFIMGQAVAEKENKMRETLRIMSLSRFSYMLANFTSEACHACISSIILFYAYMIPIWMYAVKEDILYNESPYTLLVALIFNGLSLVSLSLMMSTFFIDSKVAS